MGRVAENLAGLDDYVSASDVDSATTLPKRVTSIDFYIRNTMGAMERYVTVVVRNDAIRT